MRGRPLLSDLISRLIIPTDLFGVAVEVEAEGVQEGVADKMEDQAALGKAMEINQDRQRGVLAMWAAQAVQEGCTGLPEILGEH